MPNECRHIRAAADKLISDGLASRAYAKRNRTYMCVFDSLGAPYTITREQRFFHLIDASGKLITLSEQLDIILGMLEACLQETGSNVYSGNEERF